MTAAPASVRVPAGGDGDRVTAVPVRYPGRWVAAGVVLLLVAMFVHMIVTNKAFQWRFMADNMFASPVLEGVRTSILLTVLAMVIGVVLGIVVAVMRLSPNPVLSMTSWVYTWFFRAVPRVVLLVLFGNLGILYSRFELGLPFDRDLFGLDASARIAGIDANTLLTGFTAGLLGLALSEAAYMAEIVRAGILAVDPGQTEAAQALGLSRRRTLRRIVVPQAMRSIVPTAGNMLIGTLKGTSIVSVIAVQDLLYSVQLVYHRTYQVIPLLMVATLWYTVVTSVLSAGQFHVEKHYARGTERAR